MVHRAKPVKVKVYKKNTTTNYAYGWELYAKHIKSFYNVPTKRQIPQLQQRPMGQANEYHTSIGKS